MIVLILHHMKLMHGFTEWSPAYPRLEIPVDLPRQSSGDSSPATLYVQGVSHSIALDGTPDGKPDSLLRLCERKVLMPMAAEFEKASAESGRRLKSVLGLLEDM